MSALVVIVVLLVLMWVLLIRPQRRRQTTQQQLLSNLEVGDEIVTAGGIYGQIAEVHDAEILLEIAPGTNVRVAKRAIAGIVTEEEEDDEDVEELKVEDEEPELSAQESGDEPEREHERSTAEQRS